MQRYGRYITDMDSEFTTTQSNAISLEELCANKLVSHGVLLAAISRELPQQFINVLIQCALQHDCETSVTALLDAWRREVFVFEMPLGIKRWKVFVAQFIAIYAKRYKVISKRVFVAFIIEYVIELLSSDYGNECRIRCLDFSSFPVEGYLLRSICKFLIKRCATFSLPENSPINKCSKEEISLNYLVIKINVVMDIGKELSLLCKTLSYLKGKNIHLQVTGIHAVPGTDVNVLRLLEFIEPETLDAFSCCLNFFPDYLLHDFRLIQALKNFPNIQTLNFELDLYNVGYHVGIFFELSDLFHCLKKLKHLTLSNFDSSRRIQISEFFTDQSFSSKLSLESLLLNGFTISADELKNSSLLPRALALKTLSLTDSIIDLQSLVRLLTSCKNLRDLCLVSCKFQGGNIDLLFRALATLEKLEYLNLTDMKMNSEDLMSKAEYISHMPNLKYILISPQLHLRKGISHADFQKRFHRALEMLWNSSTRN